MITVTSKGRWKNTRIFLARNREDYIGTILHKYGQIGVNKLSAATPVDTGLTASSWGYEVESTNGVHTITWTNSNINKGVKIALILQLGHATSTGTWVEGVDYINPALYDVFNQLCKEAWKEVNE